MGRKVMVCVAAVMVVLGASFTTEAAKGPPKRWVGTVNLNQASPTQLDLLPGVGAKAVANIVAHRQKQPFARVEELVKVKGFGKKRFDKLRPYLSVQGPTTFTAQPATAAAAVQSRSTPERK
jgi:competence protein ComEA